MSQELARLKVLAAVSETLKKAPKPDGVRETCEFSMALVDWLKSIPDLGFRHATIGMTLVTSLLIKQSGDFQDLKMCLHMLMHNLEKEDF